MTSEELISRYIYDVTRRLPPGMRNDTGCEIKSLIEDMLAERYRNVPVDEQDVTAILAELGTPAELAEKYSPNKGKCLIGSKYYGTYRKVLGIVLVSAFIGIAGAQFAAFLVEKNVEYTLQSWINLGGTLWNTLLSAYAIVTIIFSIFERHNIDLYSSDNLQSLPPVPNKKEKINSIVCVVGIVVAIILAVVLLFFPRVVIFGVHRMGDDTEFFHLFKENAFDDIWYLLLIMSLAVIIDRLYKLLAGRYHVKVAIINTISNVVVMAVSPWIVLHPNVFCSANDFVGANISDATEMILDNIHWSILAVIILGCIINSIECWVRSLRYSGDLKPPTD